MGLRAGVRQWSSLTSRKGAIVLVAHGRPDARFAHRLIRELERHGLEVRGQEVSSDNGATRQAVSPEASAYVVIASERANKAGVLALASAPTVAARRGNLFLVRRNEAAPTLPIKPPLWRVLEANRDRPAWLIADELAEMMSSVSANLKRKRVLAAILVIAAVALGILLPVLSNAWYQAAAALFVAGTLSIAAAASTFGWTRVKPFVEAAQAVVTLASIAIALAGLASRPHSPPHGIGATKIAHAPVISLGRLYRGGNLDTEFIRYRLQAHERISLQWNKLAGQCCMRVYFWKPTTTDVTLPYRTPFTEFTVTPGISTHRITVPSPGDWILQMGTQNNISTDPFTLIARSLPSH